MTPVSPKTLNPLVALLGLAAVGVGALLAFNVDVSDVALAPAAVTLGFAAVVADRWFNRRSA